MLKGINLDINDGDFLVLLGPSGCGKSTLLNTIAGLETSNSGEILIDNHFAVAYHGQSKEEIKEAHFFNREKVRGLLRE